MAKIKKQKRREKEMERDAKGRNEGEKAGGKGRCIITFDIANIPRKRRISRATDRERPRTVVVVLFRFPRRSSRRIIVAVIRQSLVFEGSLAWPSFREEKRSRVPYARGERDRR